MSFGRRFGSAQYSIFRPEDGGSRFVRKLGKYPVTLYARSLQKITSVTVRTVTLANPAL